MILQLNGAIINDVPENHFHGTPILRKMNFFPLSSPNRQDSSV